MRIKVTVEFDGKPQGEWETDIPNGLTEDDIDEMVAAWFLTNTYSMILTLRSAV
jgi:hypothetical protein